MLGLVMVTSSHGDTRTIDAGTVSLLATMYSTVASARLPPEESPVRLTLGAPCARFPWR